MIFSTYVGFIGMQPYCMLKKICIYLQLCGYTMIYILIIIIIYIIVYIYIYISLSLYMYKILSLLSKASILRDSPINRMHQQCHYVYFGRSIVVSSRILRSSALGNLIHTVALMARHMAISVPSVRRWRKYHTHQTCPLQTQTPRIRCFP